MNYEPGATVPGFIFSPFFFPMRSPCDHHANAWALPGHLTKNMFECEYVEKGEPQLAPI